MKQYLGFISWLRAIWQLIIALVKTRGSLAMATEAMYRLNIYARNSATDGEKKWIYSLKNRFIRYLYQADYCVRVSQKVQKLKCWGTWQYDCGTDCPRCGGTGIYRKYVLLEFKFKIDNRYFIWHQPRSLVDWPVKVTGDFCGEYTEASSVSIEATSPIIDSLTVWWALALRRRAPRLPYLRVFYPVKWQHDESVIGTFGKRPGGFQWLCLDVEWGSGGYCIQFPYVPMWRLTDNNLGFWAPRWIYHYQRYRDRYTEVFGRSYEN